MDPLELLRKVAAALGVDEPAHLTEGGQKYVFTGKLSGVPVIGKVILLQGGPYDSVTIERARREVELLAAIDSDYVVKVMSEAVEIGDPPVAVCWLEEQLSGVDLWKRLGTEWPEDEVWALTRDLAHALKACHDLDVVHRDLSPSNVRRLDNGKYVLMDPGLARHLQRTALTGAGVLGTPGFQSPEHVGTTGCTPASDVFALGILAYYALTTKFPIDPSDRDYEKRLATTDVPSIRSLRDDISGSLAEIVDRCLKRQPARRFLDGNELIQELINLGRM